MLRYRNFTSTLQVYLIVVTMFLSWFGFIILSLNPVRDIAELFLESGFTYNLSVTKEVDCGDGSRFIVDDVVLFSIDTE